MRSSGVRGVSDVVSFTLVFSTIIFMIGVVTVIGVGTLGDVQAGTESNVAEATMRNYASSLADHRTQSAPRRSTTIKLQGHTLEWDSSVIEVRIGDGDLRTIQTGSLVRTTDTDARFVYQSGGLFRMQDGGGVVVRSPPFRCGSNTTHLAVTNLSDDNDDINIASDSRVTLESELEPDSQNITSVAADEVTIFTNRTAAPSLWNETLSGDWESTGVPDQYRCDLDDSDGRIVIHRTTVEVDVVN